MLYNNGPVLNYLLPGVQGATALACCLNMNISREYFRVIYVTQTPACFSLEFLIELYHLNSKLRSISLFQLFACCYFYPVLPTEYLAISTVGLGINSHIVYLHRSCVAAKELCSCTEVANRRHQAVENNFVKLGASTLKVFQCFVVWDISLDFL